MNATNRENIAGSPTKLRTFWTGIKNAEPSLLGAAGGKQKTQLTHVFVFVNLVVSDLTKVNWNYTGLLPDESALVAQSTKIAPDLKALKAYYKTTCKLTL